MESIEGSVGNVIALVSIESSEERVLFNYLNHTPLVEVRF